MKEVLELGKEHGFNVSTRVIGYVHSDYYENPLFLKFKISEVTFLLPWAESPSTDSNPSSESKLLYIMNIINLPQS